MKRQYDGHIAGTRVKGHETQTIPKWLRGKGIKAFFIALVVALVLGIFSPLFT